MRRRIALTWSSLLMTALLSSLVALTTVRTSAATRLERLVMAVGPEDATAALVSTESLTVTTLTRTERAEALAAAVSSDATPVAVSTKLRASTEQRQLERARVDVRSRVRGLVRRLRNDGCSEQSLQAGAHVDC